MPVLDQTIPHLPQLNDALKSEYGNSISHILVLKRYYTPVLYIMG